MLQVIHLFEGVQACATHYYTNLAELCDLLVKHVRV